MLSQDDIETGLSAFGFTESRRNTKTICFKRQNQTVFVKVGTSRQPLVVHPDNLSRYGKLAAIPGVVGEQPLKFYHNSTMRSFPERLNRGQAATKFGIAFGLRDSETLRSLLLELCGAPSSMLADDLDQIERLDVSETEKRELRNTRIGQGRFRDELVREFGGLCQLTGISQPDLLRASHIKPWRDSDPIERLDPDNGLLLAANADALFDRGYITFDQGGKILVSPVLQRGELTTLGLNDEMRIELRSEQRALYLRFHLEKIFISGRAITQ